MTGHRVTLVGPRMILIVKRVKWRLSSLRKVGLNLIVGTLMRVLLLWSHSSFWL